MLKHLLVFLIVFSGLLYAKWAVVHNEIETALEVLCSSKLNFQFLEMNFQNKRTVRSKVLFGGLVRIGSGFGQPLLFGDALLLEGLLLLIPGAEFGGGLIEGKAHGDRDFGCDQHEKDQALSPDIAATLFVAEFVQMRERLRRFRTRVVRVINDEAATGETVVA